VKHLHHLTGAGGAYEFDAVAEFRVFQGALIIVVVECKRYSSPVEREKVLSLSAKMRDVGAHKAMMFSTGGFQSGAIEFASTQGIALISFMDGKWAYLTRSADSTPPTPPPGFPRYVGTRIQVREGKWYATVISDGHTQALDEWLTT
jgi:restriction system protein